MDYNHNYVSLMKMRQQNKRTPVPKHDELSATQLPDKMADWLQFGRHPFRLAILQRNERSRLRALVHGQWPIQLVAGTLLDNVSGPA